MSEFTNQDREKLTQCYTLLTEMKEAHGKRLDDHEERIRANEKNRYMQLGFSGALGALMGFLTKFIGGN